MEDQSEYKKFEPLRQGKTKAQYENTMKILIWITAIYGVGFIAWMIYEISKYIFFITTPVQL